MDIDKIVEQMELDELSDAEKLTPRDFARMMGMSPQLVYYHIRQGKLKGMVEICACGRKVLDVKTSKEKFEK